MQRKSYPAEFKAKVALEAIREVSTLAELSSAHGVHPTMITRWKGEAIAHLPSVFSNKWGTRMKEDEKLIERLYQQIGQLKVEVDWLKKKPDPVKH